MFVSEFVCPCCGTVIQPANPVEVGRQVQCFACRTTFVVPAPLPALPPEQPPASVTLPPGYPLETTPEVWIKKREPDYRRAHGQFRRNRPPPNFGLIAFLIAGGIALILVVLLGGVLAYRQLQQVGLLSNQERLVGVWETKGDNVEATLEFRSGGQYRIVTHVIDAGTLVENIGTWELLSENGNEIRVRTIASASDGATYTHVYDYAFLDDNTFARADRREMVFHRRRSAEFNSKRERLIGVWETVSSSKKRTLDFRRNGELFIHVDNPRDEPHHEVEHGTWEILSESGEKLTVRLQALDSAGQSHDETMEVFFEGKNIFWQSGQQFRRRGSE